MVRFFERFDLPVSQDRQPIDDAEGPFRIVLDSHDAVEVELVDGRPVIPLDETIVFTKKHDATVRSALDRLDRVYENVEGIR